MRTLLFISLTVPATVFSFQGVLPRSSYNKSSQLKAVSHHDTAPSGALVGTKKGCYLKETNHLNDERSPLQERSAPLISLPMIVSILALSTSPALAFSTTSTTLATAGPIPSALLAWAHFLGILGVSGGLVTERFLLKQQMTEEEEQKMNAADGIYGLSAFSLLVTGYFRATDFAKGWDFYQHEPLFWLKMASVAVLGGLSFFPAIVLFRRDLARRDGKVLNPLSDDLVDRMTTIINAELLALLTIPLLASLMARGVLYMDNFPWYAGAGLYIVSLGGAGFKYGKEAMDMMEREGALEEVA